VTATAQIALIAVALAVAAAPARAGRRYAVLIGDDHGDRNEIILRYAESDARRLGDVLRGVGGFFPEDVVVLHDVAAEDVRRALIDLNARLRQSDAGAVLLVFYSGHADAESLHLAGTHLLLGELRNLVAGSSADARVLIVDSCRSGALTRVKGGRPAHPFDVAAAMNVVAPPPVQGMAIFTSSAAGEDAQESESLQASIFTHHLLSALLGAADRDRDGRVTIDEAFTYAAERTLAATAATLPGPQHPTYRLELGGRNDLMLTQPGMRVHDRGTLVFADAGSYLVQSGSGDGAVVAELTTDRGGGMLTVEAGRFFVTQRNREFLRQGQFSVAAGSSVAVTSEAMRRVEYARVVRKGGAAPTRAWSLFAAGGVRGALIRLGTAGHVDVGTRLDLRSVSLELRLGFDDAEHDNERVAIKSYETALSLAGLHVFDVGVLSLGVGLEGGLGWMAQRFVGPTTQPRDSMVGFVAPLVQLELPIRRSYYARLDGAFDIYFLGAASQSGIDTVLSYRLTLGGGVYF
jgi:hypothetical protein